MKLKVSAPHIYSTTVRMLELWDQKLNLAGGKIFDVGTDVHNGALDMIAIASYGVEEERTHLVKELRVLKKKQTTKDTVEFEGVTPNDELTGLVVLADSLMVALRSPIPKIHYTLYAALSPKIRKAKAAVDGLRKREIEAGIKRRQEGKAERCAVDSLLEREAAMAAKEGRKPNPHSKVIESEVSEHASRMALRREIPPANACNYSC